MLVLEKFQNEHEKKVEEITKEAETSPGICSIEWPPFEDVNLATTLFY